MLGGKFKFVSVDDVQGEGKNGAFHFANMTVSDGLESLELSLDLPLVQTAKTLKRGQDIHIDTKMKKQGYNHSVTINRISVV